LLEIVRGLSLLDATMINGERRYLFAPLAKTNNRRFPAFAFAAQCV
jgi:hypothetical protein